MKGFPPGTLGAELQPDSTISFRDAKRNARRLRERVALKDLDYALRHGEDIFEGFTDIEAEKELSDSGIFQVPNLGMHTEYHIPHPHPEEQVEHDFEGLTPQDPEYWRHRYK